MKAQFTAKTKIANSTNKAAQNWSSIKNVLLTPADNDVFLSATDGRHVAIAKVTGQTDDSYLVPTPVLPAADCQCEFNGMWKTTTGSKNTKTTIFDPSDLVASKFPNIDGILPKVDPKTHDVLVIDAELLKTLSESIQTAASGQTGISLLLPKAKDGVIAEPIAVVGSDGIGVIMPLSPQTKDSPHKKFRDTAKEYVQHFNRDAKIK